MPQDDDDEFSEADIAAIAATANLPDPFRLVYDERRTLPSG